MKKLLALLLALLMCVSLVACNSEKEPEPVEPTGMNIMFVVTGSLGGGNNVDDVKAALDAFVADKGGNVDFTECKMQTEIYESTIETAADSKKYDLIVTGFGTMVEPLTNVAKAYPDQKFLLFDAALDFTANGLENCISVQALGNEGGFLAGALAALVTASESEYANPEKTVGFVGAMESTAILDFFFGYVDGVRYVDDTTSILYSFIGNHTDSALTLDTARAMNKKGADVVFAATNSDLAVADAALEGNFYAICCDTDESAKMAETNAEEAKHIATSVIKDYNGMVTPVLYAIADGSAQWGHHSYISYGQGGVKLAQNAYLTQNGNADVLAAYNKVVDELAAGKVKVNTAYGADEAAVNAVKALCAE